jgi:hypothetical protein
MSEGRATGPTGALNNIADCYIRSNTFQIFMNNLPDITDSKDAGYAEETGMGRSTPFKTFNSGGSRKIGWKCHFISYDQNSINQNILNLRNLESCVYPRADPNNIIPYIPPKILSIKCGSLIADTEVTVVLLSYSVSFPSDQVWNVNSANGKYLPYKLDVDLNFEIVYDSRYLPGADRIIQLGA